MYWLILSEKYSLEENDAFVLKCTLCFSKTWMLRVVPLKNLLNPNACEEILHFTVCKEKKEKKTIQRKEVWLWLFKERTGALKTPLPVVSLFIFQVNRSCSSLFLSYFNCLFFPSQRTRKDNNKAPRAAANGEAVFVNGGIHLETRSVNCATQYAAQSRSDRHAVTEHSSRTHRMHRSS